jgi:hypothetical protein
MGIVTVKLDIQFSEAAPEGYYEVTDILPAGLRYVSSYQSGADRWYFGDPQDGQRVKLGCYHKGKQGKETLEYAARVSSPGIYTADSTLVKHYESDARGYSKKSSVRIK